MVSPDFAEAFESVVDISMFKSYRELACAFSHWAGRRWVDSYKQNDALRDEARKRGFLMPDYRDILRDNIQETQDNHGEMNLFL